MSDDTTTSVKTRFPYTNDVIGVLLLVSLPILIGLTGAGFIDLTVVPQPLMIAYGIVVGIDTIWMFGVDAAETWMDIRK